MKRIISPIIVVFSFLWLWPFVPTASASCPGVEVSFARGTDEPPGIGETGQEFVNALNRKIGSVGVYGVDYPASHDFTGSTIAGVTDIAHHIQYMARNCPGTRIVLGGFSQGAAVAGGESSAPISRQPVTPLAPSQV